jgi:hypothetical protein
MLMSRETELESKIEGELLKSAHERNEDLIAFWTSRLSARKGIKSCHCDYLSVITLYMCIVIVFVIILIRYNYFIFWKILLAYLLLQLMLLNYVIYYTIIYYLLLIDNVTFITVLQQEQNFASKEFLASEIASHFKELHQDSFLLRLLVIFGGAFFLAIISVKFQKFRNVGVDRISAIEKVSFHFTDPACIGSTTAFSVSMKNSVFSVTAAHIKCASSSCPNAIVHCDGLDITLILKFPSSRNALDGSQFMESRIGDDVFVRGYSDVNNNSYKASVGGTCGKNIVNKPFAGKAIVRANYRYLIGSSQSLGLSGSCVLNGYGIIGVAVAAEMFESPFTILTGLVVPWSDKMRETHTFPTLSSCNTTMSYVPSLLNKAEAFISNMSLHPFVAETANTLYHFL